MLSSVECVADLRCRPSASVALNASTSCCAGDSLQSPSIRLRSFSITHNLQRPRCKQSLRFKQPELEWRRLHAFQGFVSMNQVANVTRPESTSKVAVHRSRGARKGPVTCGLMPIDPWNPSMQVDSQSIASQLFAASLLPYLGFLYHLTRSKTAPKLTLFGFYFLLVFVGATSEQLLQLAWTLQHPVSVMERQAWPTPGDTFRVQMSHHRSLLQALVCIAAKPLRSI